MARTKLNAKKIEHLQKMYHEEDEYAQALQRAIYYHCTGQMVPDDIANRCPHHAQMLNDSLSKHRKAKP